MYIFCKSPQIPESNLCPGTSADVTSHAICSRRCWGKKRYKIGGGFAMKNIKKCLAGSGVAQRVSDLKIVGK